MYYFNNLIFQMKFNPKSYFHNVLRLNTVVMKNTLREKGKPFSRSTWNMSPVEVNAYYSPTANKIGKLFTKLSKTLLLKSVYFNFLLIGHRCARHCHFIYVSIATSCRLVKQLVTRVSLLPATLEREKGTRERG